MPQKRAIKNALISVFDKDRLKPIVKKIRSTRGKNILYGRH
jgi:hypothetical protein